jgi:hypothetical protein
LRWKRRSAPGCRYEWRVCLTGQSVTVEEAVGRLQQRMFQELRFYCQRRGNEGNAGDGDPL